MPNLLQRHAMRRLRALLAAFPVVALTGARQVGKTTLARMLLDQEGGTYRTLDAMLARTQAQEDPEGFVQADDLLVIDEVQLAPDLLRAIKLAIDRDRRPGRFLITGSADLLRLRTVTETLAGRSAWLELGPLTWAEIEAAPPPDAIDAAFDARSAQAFVTLLKEPAPGWASQARRRAIEGGMPPTLGLDPAMRREWYDAYRQTFLERDLRRLSEIENLPEFSRLLSLSLLRTGGVLNKHELAADAALKYPTARRYLNILEVACQLRLLPPFLPNIGKRLVKSPKLYATDGGMASHVANIGSWDDAASMGREGALFETWAVNELTAIDGASSARSRIMYLRRSHGPEVDVVLERGDSIVGIEIKGSATVSSRDLAGLRSLRDDLGGRFRLGMVAYLGDTAEIVDGSLCVVPIASLLGAAT
ncbi:MAG TPA: ATP-binding protein [Thermoleophilia bacterium]|nr:ATP-binding protein [Thermoleophilia bacterium]